MASALFRNRAFVAASRFVLLALAAPAVCPRAALAESPNLAVTDVRFWSLGDVTRVAIETTGEFSYKYDRLPDPPRIYLDVLGARQRVSSDELIHVIPVGDGLIKQIRVAQTAPSVTRVVLDLAGDVDFAVSQLLNPDRLMVEVRAKSATTATTEPSSAAPPKPEPPAEVTVAKPAQRNRDGSRSLTRVLGLKLGRVVLDPGHGGHDTGTIGPSGLMEKDLVLDIAKRLGILIEERMGSEVIYTRTDDVSVPLEARTELANQKKADLFLSIHANSSRLRRISGAETFYLNFTTSRADLEVAARENASSQRSIHELSELVQKIALKDKLEESRDFASSIQTSLYELYRRSNSKARDRGVKKAPFVVLIGAAMPSVLAEVGFISNPVEERLMKISERRQKLAEALYQGLSKYASTLSNFQVAKATGR
jgi:N-acetylmuramoyl-L-alanine amidase